MKSKALWAITALLCFGVSIVAYRSSASADVAPSHWTNDLDKALAEAKAKNKLVLVDFHATWCRPCKMYEEEVFPTSEFKDKTKDMILVSVDVDKQVDLSRRYNVPSLPDIRILNGVGTELGQLKGYGGPDPLYQTIDEAEALR